jgi:hypothetical protein
MKSKFLIHHFYYLLTTVLLLLGFITRNKKYPIDFSSPVIPGWHTVVFVGNWLYCIPSTALSLLTAFLFHIIYKMNLIKKKKLVVFQTVLFVGGLFLSLATYRWLLAVEALASNGAANAAQLSSQVLVGPVLLILSLILIVFILLTSKKLISETAESFENKID